MSEIEGLEFGDGANMPTFENIETKNNFGDPAKAFAAAVDFMKKLPVVKSLAEIAKFEGVTNTLKGLTDNK